MRLVARQVTMCLATVVLVAACSGPDGEPVRVDRRDVPFALVDAPDQEVDGPDATHSVSLYYLDAGRLVEVDRPAVTEPTARRALRSLLAGPSVSEQAFGATSALPSPTAARLVHVTERVARVELASGFRDGTVANQPAALAQIVFTLTALGGIDAVTFTVEGSDVAVPTADGNLVDGPVSRDHYALLLGDRGSRSER